MTRTWHRWFIAAAEAGAGIGLVDAAIALGRHGEFLSGVTNRMRLAFALVCVCSTVVALGTVAVCAIVSVARKLPAGWHSAMVQTAAIALGLAFGFALFSGTAVRRSPARPWAILATGALAAFLAQTVWTRRAALADLVTRHPRATQVSLLIASVAAYLAHSFLYVRLYPGLHAFASIGGTAALVIALAQSNAPRTRAKLAIPMLALACASALGARAVLQSDTQRALVRTRAPIASYVFALLGRIAPTHDAIGVLRDERSVQGRHLDFAGLDVVLVTVDALRADRMGAYGGQHQLTPALDALASEGIIVERAYCTTPHTSYSIASLMTGKFFHEVSALGAPPQPHEMLAVLMAGAGFATGAFFPPAVFNVDAERLGDLRERAFGFEAHTIDWATATERVREVEQFLDRLPSGRRAFVWVHFFEPHEPYELHPEGRIATSREPLDLYDGEVAAVDVAFGALREAFVQRRRRVAWIVTGDHGEEFGEHGGRFHGTSVYEEQVRVPLVIAASGIAPRRISGPLSLVDVMPTILAAVGIQRPARLRGRDIGPAAHGEDLTGETVFASAASTRLVARSDERLICDVGEGSCELYDLRSDPDERVNLADLRPTDVAQLRPLLRGWMESHGTFERETDPIAPSVPAALERVVQGDRGAATELSQSLASLDPATAARASHALGNLGASDAPVRDALAQLTAQPGDALAAARNEAALSLALLGDPRGAARARAGLADADGATARRSALALAHLGSGDGLALLIETSTDVRASGTDRAAAIDALVSLHDPGTFDAFVALLGDAQFGPTAARALGMLGDVRAEPRLETAATTSRYVLLRASAIRSLAQLGDPSASRLFVASLGGADAFPDAFSLAQRLHEPGHAIAGTRESVHVRSDGEVPLHGRVPHGPAWAILSIRAASPAMVSIGGDSVAVPSGEHEVRLAWARPTSRLAVHTDSSLDVIAAMVVAREP